MIELLTSFSIAINQAISDLPTENQILQYFSLSRQDFHNSNVINNEIISHMSLSSAPHPLHGGDSKTELKDMCTKIVRFRQQ